LFFCGIEIENVLGSAVGTRMPLRITINENNIKCLCALVAIERLFYGKNPFHLVVKARILVKNSWELEERKKKKTDKLRKVIARDEKLTCGCYRAAIGSQAFPAIASAGKGSKTGLKRYPSARTVSSL
jgi:hypothetical protein